MRKIKENYNLITNAETLGDVHTHTCNFMGINNAIFAFKNIFEKRRSTFVKCKSSF